MGRRNLADLEQAYRAALLKERQALETFESARQQPGALVGSLRLAWQHAARKTMEARDAFLRMSRETT